MKPNGWSKLSRHERGYGSSWDKVRLLVLKRDNGLCQCPRCHGKLTPANEVHHIIAKADGGTDDMDNLQSINHDCHVRLTHEELGHRVRPTIGLDGFPI